MQPLSPAPAPPESAPFPPSAVDPTLHELADPRSASPAREELPAPPIQFSDSGTNDTDDEARDDKKTDDVDEEQLEAAQRAAEEERQQLVWWKLGGGGGESQRR